MRKDPAIIPLEAVIPQADLRTEPIMSWMDLTDEVEEEKETNGKKISISTTESTESTHKEAVSSTFLSTFEKEIAELFDIPREGEAGPSFPTGNAQSMHSRLLIPTESFSWRTFVGTKKKRPPWPCTHHRVAHS